MFADVRNEPPPILARVCRDARQAVLRFYKPVVFSGVVKHVDLNRDIFLLDSYLQVRRLLKVVRLLSQIESIRRNASRLALGTSWGIQTGLHLRLFHRTVRTEQNMRRLLQSLSRFKKLEAIILVVYQRTAFNLRWCHSNHITVPWDHHDFLEPYYYRYNVNFNLENYWLRRPHETKLVQYNYEGHGTKSLQYDYEGCGTEKSLIPVRISKPAYRDPQPRGRQYVILVLSFTSQRILHWTYTFRRDSAIDSNANTCIFLRVRELKKRFEKSLHSVAENGRAFPAGSYVPPKLETATLTWIYMGSAYGDHPCQ